MLSLFKRSNGIYYILYEDGERRKWKSTGTSHKSEALKRLMDVPLMAGTSSCFMSNNQIVNRDT